MTYFGTEYNDRGEITVPINGKIGALLKKIEADNRGGNDYFGASVAIGSDRIAVGAPYEDSVNGDVGNVYLFYSNGQFIKRIVLSAVDNNGYFGWSVAICGNMIVVGAPYDGIGSPSGCGTVYTFDIHGNKFERLNAEDAQVLDEFGTSVDLNNKKIVTGAPKESGQGAVYTHGYDGVQITKFTPTIISSADDFGWSVAISGDTIIVGAPSAGTGGKAYIFDADGTELYVLEASDVEAGAEFGYSVAISGDRIVIGSRLDSETYASAGKSYIFDTDGNELHILTASDIEAGAEFGQSVSISGDKIVIGAWKKNDTYSGEGAAYIFDTEGNELSILLPEQPIQQNALFGSAVAISGDRIIIGASTEDYNNSSNSGSAYIHHNVSTNLFDMVKAFKGMD